MKGKKKTMDEREPKPEPDEQDAAVLPAREAMSIIAPDTGTGFVPDLGPVAEPTPDATTAPHAAAGDAQGSTSGEETTTSDDRSEQYENQDTAISET